MNIQLKSDRNQNLVFNELSNLFSYMPSFFYGRVETDFICFPSLGIVRHLEKMVKQV